MRDVRHYDDSHHIAAALVNVPSADGFLTDRTVSMFATLASSAASKNNITALLVQRSPLGTSRFQTDRAISDEIAQRLPLVPGGTITFEIPRPPGERVRIQATSVDADLQVTVQLHDEVPEPTNSTR